MHGRVRRLVMVGFFVGFNLLSALADIFVFVNAKNLQLYPEEEEDERKDSGMELTGQM